MPTAAHRFNVVVASGLYVLMLVFGVWVLASPRAGGAANVSRIVGGAVISAAALTLLAVVPGVWRSGEPPQSRAAHMGFALFAIGVAILGLG